MVSVINQLAVDFGRFAPELEASPKKCLYRIYRDTRFSDDKRPLKTQVAASFRWKTLPRGESAGLYLEVNPGWVWMGGGFYSPETSHLARIRQHISDTHPALQRISRAPAFTRTVGVLDGERLTRVPRGFAKEDPAAEFLKYRSFLAGCEFPPEFATSPKLYPTLVATFRALMPLVRFLNEPLVTSASTPNSQLPTPKGNRSQLVGKRRPNQLLEAVSAQPVRTAPFGSWEL
jgi:uncharacterized protein (TIGR02453 family)